MSKIHWCKNCLNASTRPRIEFDERGWCNACQWSEEKKDIDWAARENELKDLISKHKRSQGFDCIVPVSGGKDGSYIAYNLKNKYGLNPLCVTIRPPLSMEIGDENLKNFIFSGYDHIHVTPDPVTMQKLDRIGFIEYGQGYYGWLIAIHTSIIRVAQQFGIELIVYAEDGEIEYGGSTIYKNEAIYGAERMKSQYLNGTVERVLAKANLSKEKQYWFTFDNDNFINKLDVTHYSYFEAWDSYRNYLIAKEHCGLKELEVSNTGTFTNFAQNDQKLAALHYYLMYLKFGFGRATQDAGIEIRRGAMTREQAILLVGLYDNQAPIEYYGDYQEYFEMDDKEFKEILEKFVNRDLFDSNGEGLVKPKFDVGRK